MAALVAAKIALVSDRLCVAFGNAGRDDALFVDLAHSLSEGLWLGPYDALTLVKGPVYPIWIAALHRMHVPLFLGQDLLYAFACWMVIRALRPLRLHPMAELFAFAVVLFDPMTWSVISLRVVRTGIYPALTLLVLAAAAGIHTHRDGPRSHLAAWSVLLGASLAAFWLTREEGIWLLPSLALLLAVPMIALWRSGLADRGSRLWLASAWLGVFALLVGAVCCMNWIRYGLFTTVETLRPEYRAAYGALTRVTSEPPIRYVPVPRATRERIYRESPAFRELEPHLEGPVGRFWTSRGGPLRPAGEIAAGQFPFALRASAQAAGHHDSGPEAMAYYRRLAREVNDACEASRLACGPPRATPWPAWSPGDGPLLARTVLGALGFLVRFEEFSPEPVPASGDAWRIHLFQEMTREPIATAEALRLRRNESRSRPPLSLRLRRGLGRAFQRLFPWGFAASVAVWSWVGLRAARRRRMDFLFVFCTALLVACAARAVLLSWIEISMFVAVDSLYFSPAYPLMLLFFGLALTAPLARGSRTATGRLPAPPRTPPASPSQ